MSENLTGPWIEVWPFDGRSVNIKNIGAEVNLSPQLQAFVDTSWQPKKDAGWKSSWVAFMKELAFTLDQVEVKAGAMQFHQIDGMNKAIEARGAFRASKRLG